MAVITQSSSGPSQAFQTKGKSAAPSSQTIVPIGEYNGLVGTMYHIVFEEGTRSDSVRGASKMPGARTALGVKGKTRKGQGLEGLWRGWRVGIWGLVGVWGAATLGGAGKGGEF
jgi:fusion and transport protein UGO1